MENYRRVSKLYFISNILERYFFQQLVDYLHHKNVTYVFQSAYRPHHSAQTLLIETANDIILRLDKRHVSLLTMLDLSSAFDTIDHNIQLGWINYFY